MIKFQNKPIIAVAGASGFVGTHLRRHLSQNFSFRALTRSPNIAEGNTNRDSTEWRVCDLYSLPQLTKAMEGCKLGLYLVHSMAPSSRLMQAKFEDLDLLLADNYIRAAEKVGIEHIIYLSGLMPNENYNDLSPHLKSRFEVEGVLRSRSVSVTVIRAGIIFGPGGSSFAILVNLVRRLPFMIFPTWTQSMTQSIDISDVCRAFEICLKEASEFKEGTYDLSGHKAMSYREMLKELSKILKRYFFSVSVPFNFLVISKYWVSYFGKIPIALVGPLQETLKHNLFCEDNKLSKRLESKLKNFKESVMLSVGNDGAPKKNPRSITQKIDNKELHKERRVRSVQRMPLPENWNSKKVALVYSDWLSKKFRGIVIAKNQEDGKINFYLFHKILLLQLTPTPYSISNLRRSAFYISDGLLVKKTKVYGRFEFRLFPEYNCLIAAIHNYSPTIPWILYSCTQSIIHLRVMRSFSKYLSKK